MATTKKTRKRTAKPKPEEGAEEGQPQGIQVTGPFVFKNNIIREGDSTQEQPPMPVDLPADGTLIRMDGEPVVYVMHGGQRRPFASKEAFVACGFGWGDIIVLSPAEIDPIPVGPEVVRQGDL